VDYIDAFAEMQLGMLSGFFRQNRQVLFQEVHGSMSGPKSVDFTENCRLGKDTMLSRMFQVMENFQFSDCMVAEGTGLGYSVATRRIKAYTFTTKSGKMCRRLSYRGTGWNSGDLRLGAVFPWSVSRINWLF